MNKAEKLAVNVECAYCGCAKTLLLRKKEAFNNVLPGHVCESCGKDDGIRRARETGNATKI